MRGSRTRYEARLARERSALLRQAKAQHRLRHLVQLSAKGMSKQDAARHVGMTVAGVGSLLTKHLGTKRWPIQPSAEAGE